MPNRDYLSELDARIVRIKKILAGIESRREVLAKLIRCDVQLLDEEYSVKVSAFEREYLTSDANAQRFIETNRIDEITEQRKKNMGGAKMIR